MAICKGGPVFNRLSTIDLPRRLEGVASPPLVQLTVAFILLAIVASVRLTVDAFTPGVAPFSLLFPAVLVATLTAGWFSGAVLMVVGGVAAWGFVMAPRGLFVVKTASDAVSLALYFISAGAIVAFAEAHRRNTLALRDSEARIELATTAAGVGVWEWRLATQNMVFSEEARAICGFPPGEPVTVAMALAMVHPDDRAFTQAQSLRARDPEVRDIAPYEYRIITPDGEERWVVATGRTVFKTIRGIQHATHYVGALQDVTARKRAEIERAEGAARLRLAIEAGRMAVWQVDIHNGIATSPELNRILGFADEAQPTTEDLRALYLPGEYQRIRDVAQAAIGRGERYFDAEYRIRRRDGALRWLLLRAEIGMDDRDQPLSAIGVLLDITERKDSEERLKLLAREVDHRANNLLAVVQSTIQLSQAPDADLLKLVLLGRVSALGRAHQLLSEARWEGADLRRLVEEELLAFSLGEAARVSIRGPDVALAPAAAQAIAMALHELATNAAKYGSLSMVAGRVEVSWTRKGHGPLMIAWVETGGPAVAPPSRRGLGTTMLARALSGSLKGAVRLDWRPEGLVCELELPSAALESVGP